MNYQQFYDFIIQIKDSYVNFEQIIFEIDLEKIDKESLKNALRKVWEDDVGDMNFDFENFENLCGKFGFTPLDILVYNPYIVPQMSRKVSNNSDYQLVLVFDDDTRATNTNKVNTTNTTHFWNFDKTAA